MNTVKKIVIFYKKMENITLPLTGMIHQIKYYSLPLPLLEIQKNNPFIKNLWLSEIGRFHMEKKTVWTPGKKTNHLLIYCHSGQGIIQFSSQQFLLGKDQFIIIPKNTRMSFFTNGETNVHYYIAGFNGLITKALIGDYLRVRDIIPSVNNLVANREMLFDEIFRNLSKGFHDENMNYINFCFGHLMATFVFAFKTSDDLEKESNPVIGQALEFFEKNLDQKITLYQISREVGYSPTYFSTIFRNSTGYTPLNYFLHLKILKACDYLDQTNMKIKEIAFRLGYTDPYYFSKDFSKRMGLSPRLYRFRIKTRKDRQHKKIETIGLNDI